MIIFIVAYIIPKTKEKGKCTTAFFLAFFTIFNLLFIFSRPNARTHTHHTQEQTNRALQKTCRSDILVTIS